MYVISEWEDLPSPVQSDVELYENLGMSTACSQGLVTLSTHSSIRNLVDQSFVRPGEHVAWYCVYNKILYIVYCVRRNIHLYRKEI
jgi:hypothetical protein